MAGASAAWSRSRVLATLFLGSIGLCLPLASVSGDPSPSSLEGACGAADREIATLAAAPAPIRYGFFTDFDPLSHAATQDPSDPAFDVALGYEPALIAAVGTLSDGRVRFAPRGIGNPFSGIWLRSADADFDLVGGGITALEQRRYDPQAPATARITFGVGHVRFRQSLLVRNDSAIRHHDDLDRTTTVGALRGTTGESRLLQLAGITDQEGYVTAGTVIEVGGDAKLVTGERTHRITPAFVTPGLEARERLQAPDGPRVIYLPSENAQVEAVTSGRVDAVARGEVGNLIAAGASAGELRVTAIDAVITERGAFSYPNTEAGDRLRTAMDALLTCLTDDGAIGFPQWHADTQVFQERAVRLAAALASVRG